MKILIAGLGSIGQRHARNLRGLLGAKLQLLGFRSRGLSHVINPDLTINPNAELETEYQIEIYHDFSAALHQKPNAVFICTPNSMHMPFALAAARAGCHLFIEKPLSHDLTGVPELIDLVENKGLVCLVGYQLRFHPGLSLVKRLLAEEAIGPIISLHLEFGEYLPGWHKYEDYRAYHAARKDQGGGVLLSQIHDLDYVYSLFGLPERVFALGGKASKLEIDVEDTADILMQFNISGKTVPAHIHQDYLQRPPVRRCELVGLNGKIIWDYYGQQVCVHRVEQGISETYNFERFDRNQMFIDELQHFIACLAGTETPRVNIHDGVNSLKMALAAKQSLETGKVQELA
jgi:predicted dehydrogenase